MNSIKKIYIESVTPKISYSGVDGGFKPFTIYLNIPENGNGCIKQLKEMMHSRFGIHRNYAGKPESSFGIELNYSSVNCAETLIIGDKTPVGIDIENRDTSMADEFVSEQYFSDGERKLLEDKSFGDNKFLILWTRREALLKMIGTGLIDEMKYLDLRDGSSIFPDKFLEVVDVTYDYYYLKTFLIGGKYVISYCCADTEREFQVVLLGGESELTFNY
ncbi:MAG: 4'-phosphopantetheinyl transferase superfamily protein [Ignavibacteriaceae bacterium]|jgi:hypothetical protein|nr:MAG: 4-phosphopantetheinyl transferase family protein [Chlorobiota bacterium]KXK04711.1 MAG: hypothetical protein UZ04_CHB001001090 [Chlorobi bacterium OLB4]MBV6399427.1 hypothetical protein [Ignavibacteria bacterium]MCC6886729.1 4'-phosphopantetheinyl transferase superfamily protein [Ignavibacteriales bacterium]MCE7953132.1 4-phosphopantetheinyl transferase family protein [Chlorobi bacterium CHB7]MEB2329085.1 4'-phosphopantetheinyl transferase superfamily protein [Ignavibacteriaceae bacter